MKVLGLLLIVAGLIGAACSIFWPQSAPYSDVVNIGRLNDREVATILSAAAFLSGCVLMGLGIVVDALLHPDEVKKQEEERKRSNEQWEERRRQEELARERMARERQAKFDDGVAIFAKQTKKATAATWYAIWSSLTRLPGRLDGVLARASGSDNVIIYRFLQILCYLVIPACVAVAVLMVR